MSERASSHEAFDEYAASYEEALASGLSVSGENADFFARERVRWLEQRLARLGLRPRRVLDFGCGIGTSVPHLLRLPGVDTVLAADPSARSLAVARERYGTEGVEWVEWGRLESTDPVDLVFTNGVFHHIPLGSRAEVIRDVRRRLRPAGSFALWDNNPWSPAARYVMSRIPFDAHADLAWPGQMRRWLRAGGFTPLRTDYRFLFPRLLASLRPLEPLVARIPLGAQYQILSRAD